MNIAILHQLDYRPRTFLRDGYRIDMESAAFVGINGDGDFPRLCVGLVDQKNHLFTYEAGYRFQPITAWRAMRILDQVEIIFYNTIQKIFALSANQNSAHTLARRLDEVAWYIPKIAELHKAAIQEPIADEIINAILQICNESSEVPADINELKWAVEAGIIHQTKAVEQAYSVAAKVDQQIELQEKHTEELLRQTLPTEKSFSAFCNQFGIKHFCDNPTDGSTYWSMSQIDKDIITYGVRVTNPECELWCAEYPPGAMQTGHVGHPVLELSDQRKVIMSLVYFDQSNNDMRLILHNLFDAEDSENLTLAEVAAYEPKFIGHTLNNDDFESMEDVKRGYYSI